MKNFVQDGHVITVTLAADIASGAGLLSGSVFGVASHAGVNGGALELQLVGVFDMVKSTDAGSAVTALGPVYWDDTAKKVTGDDATGSNKLIGVALAAAADGVAEARVRLNGVSV